MTLQEAAKAALAVQSACNLSGILRSYVEAVDAIRAEGPAGEGIMRHPISRLFAEQVGFLAGIDAVEYSEAYAACERLAMGPQTSAPDPGAVK